VVSASCPADYLPTGLAAEGRWYGFGAVALPAGKGVRAISLDGIYTSEYVKEDGKWKIEKLKFHPISLASPTEGWVKKERIAAITVDPQRKARGPVKPLDREALYPSGYIVPFHFKHPVTGKKTSEAKHNALVKRMQTTKPQE
jgi:SnoaL-like domain